MMFIAWRQMLARKKQTVLILLGISLGTMIYIMVAGIQLGMREYMFNLLMSNSSHIRISGRESIIDSKNIRSQFFDDHTLVNWVREPSGKRDEAKLTDYQSWQARLNADPQVLAFAPRVSTNALVTFNKSKEATAITGIIPSRQNRVTDLGKYVDRGNIMALENGAGQIIMGSGLLKKLGATIGSTVQLSAGGEQRPFRVMGSITMGNKQIDESISLAHLRDVQQVNRTPGRITEIAVALVDGDRSTEIANSWSLLSPDKVESWQEVNESFMQLIAIQDITRNVITGAILIVAAFGVYNVLSIMIAQKRKEIAILRSLGYTPSMILELFVIQGLLLGAAGAVVGLALGHIINLYIESIELSVRIGQGNHLIISYDYLNYVVAFVASVVASLIAAMIPAWQASRLTPIDIIRSET